MGHSGSSAATPSVDHRQVEAERAEERFRRAWRFAQAVLGVMLLWQAVNVVLALMSPGGGFGGVVFLVVLGAAFVRLWHRRVAGARMTYFVFIFFGLFKLLMLGVMLLAVFGGKIHSDTLWAVVALNVVFPSLGFVAALMMARADFTQHCYN